MPTTQTARKRSIIAGALTNPNRRRILSLLEQGPATTNDILDYIPTPVAHSTLSIDLGVLKRAGLIYERRLRDHKTKEYRLSIPGTRDAYLYLTMNKGK